MEGFNLGHLLILTVIGLVVFGLYLNKNSYIDFFRSLVIYQVKKGRLRLAKLINYLIYSSEVREHINISIARYFIENKQVEEAEKLIEKVKSPVYKSTVIEELIKYYIEVDEVDKVEGLLDNGLQARFQNNIYKHSSSYLIKNDIFERYADRLSQEFFVESLAYKAFDYYLKRDKIEKARELYSIYPICYQKGKVLLKLVKRYRKEDLEVEALDLVDSLEVRKKDLLFINRFRVASYTLLSKYNKAIECAMENEEDLAVEELGMILDYIYTHNIEGIDDEIYDRIDEVVETIEDRYKKEHAWVEVANLAIAGGRSDRVERYTRYTYESMLKEKHSYKMHDTAKLFHYLKDYSKQVFLVDILARNRITRLNENEVKGINIAFWGSLLEDFIKFIAESEIVIEDTSSLSYESFLELVTYFDQELETDEKKDKLHYLSRELRGREEVLFFILEYIKLIKIKLGPTRA